MTDDKSLVDAYASIYNKKEEDKEQIDEALPLVGMAAGLAMEGKIPIAYSITPFILYRPLEFIRNLVNEENIPVKIVGSGRDEDYGALGFSHYATDDEQILSSFTNLKIYKPEMSKDLDLSEILYNNQPCYLNLKR